MSDLSPLISRIGEAKGPDREIDRDILDALDIGVHEFDPGDGDVSQWRVWADGSKVANTRVTASLDAADELVERKLIEPHFTLSGPVKYLNIPSPVPNYWWAEIIHGRSTPYIGQRGWGATAPLALLVALLRALEHQHAE